MSTQSNAVSANDAQSSCQWSPRETESHDLWCYSSGHGIKQVEKSLEKREARWTEETGRKSQLSTQDEDYSENLQLERLELEHVKYELQSYQDQLRQCRSELVTEKKRVAENLERATTAEAQVKLQNETIASLNSNATQLTASNEILLDLYPLASSFEAWTNPTASRRLLFRSRL